MTINLRTVQTDQTLSISNRDLQERVKKAEIMAQKLKQTEDGDTGTADGQKTWGATTGLHVLKGTSRIAQKTAYLARVTLTQAWRTQQQQKKTTALLQIWTEILSQKLKKGCKKWTRKAGLMAATHDKAESLSSIIIRYKKNSPESCLFCLTKNKRVWTFLWNLLTVEHKDAKTKRLDCYFETKSSLDTAFNLH